jgi:hypothetical protein
VLLCDSDDLDGQVKTQIRKHLVEASGQAMQHFLGIADGRAVPSADSEWPYRVARRLWTAQFGLVFDARRTTVRSIDEARDLVLLAATVPRSDVRARLQRILERRWEEGPAALKSAGWAQTILSEPGILAVLKSTRRNRPVTAQPESKDRGNSVQQRKERRESKEKKEKKDPWLDAEELLVGEFCRRFSLAALSQVRSATATPRPTPALPDESHDPPFPVALHSRAAVVAKYRVQWPGNHAGKLADTAPDPMEISYLRIEQKARPWSVRGHYERAVKGHKVHPLKDGIWIEAIVPAAKEGRTRSIDVLLTRANPKAETPPDEAQELTVEILTVDIPPLEVAGGVSRRTATDPDADASP